MYHYSLFESCYGSSLPIDAQKVTFHDGFISLKQAFEKLESVSIYKIAYNDSQLMCRERS